MMRILVPIIALVLIGCGPKPEEMVVGEWKVVGKAEFNLRFRGDGVVEMLNVDPTVMGDWQIVDGKVELDLLQADGKTMRMLLDIESPSKMTWFEATYNVGDGDEVQYYDPPQPLYRIED